MKTVNNVSSNVISKVEERKRRGCSREFNYTIAHLSGKGYYFPLDYNLVIKFVAALPHSFVVVSSR